MVEIMDTTLRDGEQTSGVSFSQQEKLSVVRLLLQNLQVNRVEIASARVSDGEFETVKKICAWANANGYAERVEILGFVDGGASLKWIAEAQGKTMNLLTKGSRNHLIHQLRKTQEQHLAEIKQELDLADKLGINVNMYLEDWSNGIQNSPDYVFYMVDGLRNSNIKRFMLPDTLGVLTPDETYDFVSQMVNRYPELHFDFHAHNDYDLSVANSAMAIKAGAKGLHATVNGLGERAGNTPLTSLVAVLHDKLQLTTSIVENELNRVARVVETYSGMRIPANQPVVGENVFTQCAGVHADGDNKKNLYYNDLLPERFGRTREYALGKMSGKANIKKNLEALGIELDNEAMTKVTQRIISLGDKKEIITQEDLPYIIADVLKNDEQVQKIQILAYSFSIAHELNPVATVKVSIDGEIKEATAAGVGQYHAFSKTLWKIYSELGKPKPELLDFEVIIPPGGQTNALVQTVISWRFKNKEFKTRGLDGDQIRAAIYATEKMLNIIETIEE